MKNVSKFADLKQMLINYNWEKLQCFEKYSKYQKICGNFPVLINYNLYN